jgi:hypothetical protein
MIKGLKDFHDSKSVKSSSPKNGEAPLNNFENRQ